MSLFVILDDSDGAIQYSPLNIEPALNLSNGWNRFSGLDGSFQNTSTAALHNGATMKFTFSGTSINLYASLQNSATATYDFIFDGDFGTFNQTASGPDTLYHQRIFSADSLSDGNHTLEMVLPTTNTTFSPGGSNVSLYLDYLIYEPTPNATVDTGYLFVDDTSDYIQYSSYDWELNTIQNWDNVSYMSYNNSLTTSIKSGATANITFMGRDIVGWGAIPVSNGSSTYGAVISDGGAPQYLTAPSSFDAPNGVSNIRDGIAWNQKLFWEVYTDDGPHTVTFLSLVPGAFNLDFVMITNDKAYIPAVLSAGLRPTTASAGATAPSTATTTPNSVKSGVSTSHIKHSSIVGGTICAFVVLSIIAVLILLRRRRLNRSVRNNYNANMIRINEFDVWSRYEDSPTTTALTPTNPGFGVTPLLTPFPIDLGQPEDMTSTAATVNVSSKAISSSMLSAPIRPKNSYAGSGMQGLNPAATDREIASANNAPSSKAPTYRSDTMNNMSAGRISPSSFMPREGRHSRHESLIPSPPPPVHSTRASAGDIPNTSNRRTSISSSTTTSTWATHGSPPPTYTYTASLA